MHRLMTFPPSMAAAEMTELYPILLRFAAPTIQGKVSRNSADLGQSWQHQEPRLREQERELMIIVEMVPADCGGIRGIVGNTHKR